MAYLEDDQIPNYFRISPDTLFIGLELFPTPHAETFLFEDANIKNIIISVAMFEPYKHENVHHAAIQSIITAADNFFVNLENIYVFDDTNTCIDKSFDCKYNIEFFECIFWLMQADPSQYFSKSNNISKPWDGGNGKICAIFGDIITRSHKVCMLYYLYQNNLLDQIDYSATHLGNFSNMSASEYISSVPSPAMRNVFKQVGIEYSKENVLAFYNTVHRVFENDDYVKNSKGDVDEFFNNTHCFPDNWKESSVILSVETHPHDRHITFTEKTTKIFLSGVPFIAVDFGDRQHRFLENMNFRTFIKYTDYPEYSNNSDITIEACELIYLRAKSFVNNIPRYKNDILKDIKHNYEHAQHIREQTLSDVYSRCPPLRGMTQNQIYNLLQVLHSSTGIYDKYNADIKKRRLLKNI